MHVSKYGAPSVKCKVNKHWNIQKFGHQFFFLLGAKIFKAVICHTYTYFKLNNFVEGIIVVCRLTQFQFNLIETKFVGQKGNGISSTV